MKAKQTSADRYVNWRDVAHKEFDRLWQSGYMTRGQAYAWLARRVGQKEAHFSDMDFRECRRVVRMVREWIKKEQAAWTRMRRTA